MATVTTPTHNYPIPEQPDDTRMSFGLLADTRTVLLRHGYPELTTADLGDLRAALTGFIHGTDDTGGDYDRDHSLPIGGPLPQGIDGIPLTGRSERNDQ